MVMNQENIGGVIWFPTLSCKVLYKFKAYKVASKVDYYRTIECIASCQHQYLKI